MAWYRRKAIEFACVACIVPYYWCWLCMLQSTERLLCEKYLRCVNRKERERSEKSSRVGVVTCESGNVFRELKFDSEVSFSFSIFLML